MTITRLEGNDEKYTCTKDASSDTLTCDSNSFSNWVVHVEPGTGVAVIIKYTGIEAEKFICEVKVDDVSDTKYVYADALEFSASFVDSDIKTDLGTPYRIDSSPTVQISISAYGDNTEPRIGADFNVELALQDINNTAVACSGVSSDNTTSFADDGTAIVTCNGVFTLTGKGKQTLKIISITAEKINDQSITYLSTLTTIPQLDLYEECDAGEYLAADTCTACTYGKRGDNDNQMYGCLPCSDANDQCPNSDNTGCEPRTGGKFVSGGWMCEFCPPGTAPTANFKSCEACPVNSYREESSTLDTCTPCDTGNNQYAPVTGSSSCLNCSGTITDNTCQPCPAGQGLKGGDCAACEVGHWSAGGTCKVCDVGYYQDETGQSSCKICTAGKYQDSTGQDSCKNCDVNEGKYSENDGSNTCSMVDDGYKVKPSADGKEQCETGTARSSSYNDNNSYTTCKPCLANDFKYSDSLGKTSCDNLPAGHALVTETRTGVGGQDIIVGVGITECVNGTSNNGDSVTCKLCDATKGEYQPLRGQSSCQRVSAGSIVIEPSHGGATMTEQCDEGTYRGYYDESFTQCIVCPGDKFQPYVGQPACLSPQTGYRRVNSTNEEPCPAGTREVGGQCNPCVSDNGEYQPSEGQTSCLRVPPGYKAINNTAEPEKCQKGQFSENNQCVPCDAELGMFQDKEGQSFCITAKPGSELQKTANGAYRVDVEPKACSKGSYSPGSTPACIKCDNSKKEYQNENGAPYCKVCSKGTVNADATHCEGLKCATVKEEYPTIDSSNSTFVFSETSVDETIYISCNKTDTSSADRIYKTCYYNEQTEQPEWGDTNTLACPTANTKTLQEVQSATNEVLQAEGEQLTKGVESINNNIDLLLGGSSSDSSGDSGDSGEGNSTSGDSTAAAENTFTSRDVTDVASTLSSLSAVFGKDMGDNEEAKNQTKILKQKVAETITKVAGSGSSTLKVVDSEQKKAILQSVEALAGSMEDEDEPIVSEKLAVKSLSTNSSDGGDNSEAMSLPVPGDMDEKEAPTLSLGDMTAAGASVAVFSADSKDMFPDPTSAIDADDAAGDEADEDVVKDENGKANINRTLNSCIVSLKFKDAEEGMDFSLQLQSNVTVSEENKDKKLSQKCAYFNETTLKWSTKGCVTTEGEDGKVTCRCDHTTSFAILLSISEIKDKTQDKVSTAMAVVNLVYLSLTFLAIVPFKKLRQRQLVMLQNQLVLSLILGNIAFLLLSPLKVDLDEDGNPSFKKNPACIIGVIVVQYLFLASIAWMTCCTYTLYQKICEALKSFGKVDKFYVHKCAVGCWVLPLLLPVSAYITSTTMADGTTPYIPATNQTTCWVDSPWKWVGFMIPCYICLLLNFTVFAMITRVMFRAAQNGSGSMNLQKQVKGVVTIAITVGVPWLTFLLTSDPWAIVGQYLFIILTGLQGPVMFVVYVILQEEVLSCLLTPLGLEVPAMLQGPASSKAGASMRSRASVATAVTVVKKDESLPKIKEQKDNLYANEAAIVKDADVEVPIETVPPPPPPEQEEHLYSETGQNPSLM